MEPTSENLELMEARHGLCLHNGYRAHLEGLTLLRANSHKAKTDGFKPGYHPALGIEIRTHEHYQRELKARGLVEVGNDRQEYKKQDSRVITDDVIKDAIDKGAQISGNEAEALKSGTYKSDAPVSAD